MSRCASNDLLKPDHDSFSVRVSNVGSFFPEGDSGPVGERLRKELRVGRYRKSISIAGLSRLCYGVSKGISKTT